MTTFRWPILAGKAMAVLLTISLTVLSQNSPQTVWDFDNGKNVDSETGMTEFSRAPLPVFPGLMSRGRQSIQLLVTPKVDAGRLFVSSQRGMAMRTGVESATGAVFSASAHLPIPLSKNEGSIAFWMCAEDWDGSQKGLFRIFLAANDDSTPRSNELLFYKHRDENRLRFLIGDNDSKQWCFADCDIRHWKRGGWHFVCASWTPSDLTLFVDGKTVQRSRPRLSANDYYILNLGTRGWKDEGGLTLLDDVRLFPHALKREEMEEYYVQTRPIFEDISLPLVHRLGLSHPELDGVISAFEYGFTLNSTFDIDSGELSADSRWAVAHDKENLYFAFDTQKPARPPTVTKHDGNVWQDESIEFHLEHGGRHWQFILNSSGVVYDSLDLSPKWNAPGLRQKQRLDNTRWVAELAVPFADLGISPVNGDTLHVSLCRSSGTSTGHIAASPLLRRFDDQGNFIKAVLDQKCPPMDFSYQTLPGSDGNLEMTVALPAEHECSFQLLGCDPKGRKLYEHTAHSRQSAGRTQVNIHASGLAKEGVIAYTLTEEGHVLAQADFKYLSPERIKVRHLLVHEESQTLETTLALTPTLPPDQRIIQLLKDKEGMVALRQEIALPLEDTTKYSFSLSWDLSSLPPGDYDYYLTSMVDSQEKTLHHQLFQKPAPVMPWTDFHGGIETAPPAPWHTPIQAATMLKCLTQTYDFAGRLFPSQIHSQGNRLLSKPISIRLNGKILDMSATWTLTKETPLETHFRTQSCMDGVELTVNGVLEYDGWLRLSLTYASIDPLKPTAIDDMALVIPMSPEASSLVTSFVPQYSVLPSGVLDKRCHCNLMEHPVFWVGNADHGLFWGADSMRGTHLANTEETLIITPTTKAEGAISCIRIVDTRLVLATPRTFAFGLQATPVKPLRRLPRPWMIRGGDTITSGPPWTFFRIFNYSNPAYIDCGQAHRQVVAAGKRTPIYGFYACIYGVSPFCPEWPWHCERWLSSPPGPGQFKQDYPTNNEKARDQGVWTFGCVANPDFLNWQLFDKNLLIQNREVGLRDMYVDMAYPRACDNPLHGCGWQDDFGHTRKTYPINANRTFTKRLRKLLRDKDKDSVLMYHASDETLPPICGLVDFTFDGEVYVADVARSENYFDILSPSLMQSAFTGARTGTNAVYVSQLNRAAMLHNPARSEYWRRKVKAPEAVRAVRHLLGYCLLHDIRPQAGAGIYNEGEILERQLYSLGYDKGDFTFHPYWSDASPITVTGTALVSAYSFPHSTLAVIVNDSKTEEAKVALSLLNGTIAKRVYDLEDGQQLNFPIKVPPKGFRLVVFEQVE
ncbi:MAG: hypothetical protein IJJ33_02815 [Victivallales bacterium]|nr:hypothetical protein [Victivallales bacterium]